MSVTLELPWPPSVNHYLRHVELPLTKFRCPACQRFGKVRVATLISSDGRDWLRAVDRLLVEKKLPLISGLLAVHITLHPPNRREIDVDNRGKPILDSLKRRPRDEKQLRWLFRDDDSQVKDLHTVFGPIVEGGLAVVKITQIEGLPVQAEMFGVE